MRVEMFCRGLTSFAVEKHEGQVYPYIVTIATRDDHVQVYIDEDDADYFRGLIQQMAHELSADDVASP